MKKYIALLITAAFTFAPAPQVKAAAFPLKICIVTGDELGDEPIDLTYKGRTIRLCCKSCARKFNANPEKYIAILDKQLAARKK
jgi:hypothetical protein